MIKARGLSRAALAVGALVGLALIPSGASGVTPKILDWDTMVPVRAPFTAAANIIRGVQGGGAPWVIGTGRGELWTDGTLRVRVRGLVLDPSVPGVGGTNPTGDYRAIVSCMSVDATGAPAVINRSTAAFPTTTGGDATIREKVDLPTPCIGPIVFVANTAGNRWFAATGM